MDSRTKPDRRSAARDRLGLPAIAGQRALAASLVVDSLGDGLFVPFAIIYFLHTTSLSLPTIGVALSAAGFVAIGTVIPAGVLLDRLPPARLVVTANLLSAVAFAGYLTVSHIWQLVLFALLAAVGSRLYWTANLALIGDAFAPRDRSRWFAFQRALRNTGFGLGGLLGAVAISVGSTAGYHALAAVNAVSYLAAALLVFTWARRRWRHRADRDGTPSSAVSVQLPTASTPAARPGGFRIALTDRPFLLIVATNLLFVLCSLVLDVLLAVYVTRGLGLPVWLTGVLFALNTGVVALAQTITSRTVEGLTSVRMLQLTALVWACAFAVFWLSGLVPAPAAIALLLIAVLVFTLAEMIQGPALNNLVVAIAPEAVRGRYLGVYQLSWGAGSAAAPALFSWLYTGSSQLPWIVLGLGCLAWAGLLGLKARQLADR
jgi:MFS family permease